MKSLSHNWSSDLKTAHLKEVVVAGCFEYNLVMALRTRRSFLSLEGPVDNPEEKIFFGCISSPRTLLALLSADKTRPLERDEILRSTTEQFAKLLEAEGKEYDCRHSKMKIHNSSRSRRINDSDINNVSRRNSFRTIPSLL